jgi:hypothetical protein
VRRQEDGASAWKSRLFISTTFLTGFFMATSTTPAHAEVFQRVIKELCELVGFRDHNLLVKGGKLRIDDYTVSFIRDAEYMPDHIFVYIDMGPCGNSSDKEGAYKALLKINFELLAGARGAISVHPETENVFYSFRYELGEKASGRNLLDSLIRFIGDIGIEALDVPMNYEPGKKSESKAGHMKMSRLIRPDDKDPKPKK